MAKLYKYIMLGQDGNITDLGASPKKSLQDIYGLLDCSLVEIIPQPYQPDMFKGKRVTIYGDEEGRFNSSNHRNPYTKVLKDFEGSEWDCVGNLLVEGTAK